MTFEQWYELKDYPEPWGYERSVGKDAWNVAWNAAVEETKKECARAIRKQCGREWIEAHYDLIEETIMEVEV